jgi:hypothetical protein
MEATDPTLVLALVTMCVGSLMVHAGLAKRQLSWRQRRPRRVRRRRR